jgi:hypothetical protein
MRSVKMVLSQGSMAIKSRGATRKGTKHPAPLLHKLSVGLTHEQAAVRRQPFALSSAYFVSALTDDLSKSMLKKVQNRYGFEI